MVPIDLLPIFALNAMVNFGVMDLFNLEIEDAVDVVLVFVKIGDVGGVETNDAGLAIVVIEVEVNLVAIAVVVAVVKVKVLVSADTMQ